MKKVILVISEQFQGDACGFVVEFEKIGGQLDGIVCLQAERNFLFYLKKSVRFLKKIKPSYLQSKLKIIIARLFGTLLINEMKQDLAYQMPSSKVLLNQPFDLFAYAKRNKIPLFFKPAFTEALVKELTASHPVIFPMYAGGIWSKAILAVEKAELINAHMGEMPQYRGMNVIEWAVLENKLPKVAVMTMNEIIDGGDVIYEKEIPVNGIKNIPELRKIGFETCYKAMAEGVYKYQQQQTIRTVQKKGAKYYYRMHKNLKTMLEKKLLNQA